MGLQRAGHNWVTNTTTTKWTILQFLKMKQIKRSAILAWAFWSGLSVTWSFSIPLGLWESICQLASGWMSSQPRLLFCGWTCLERLGYKLHPHWEFSFSPSHNSAVLPLLCSLSVWKNEVKVAQSCPILDRSLLGFSLHRTLQASILEWVAIPRVLYHLSLQGSPVHIRSKDQSDLIFFTTLRMSSEVSNICHQVRYMPLTGLFFFTFE